MDNKEIRLIGRAIKEDWPIDEGKRQRIVEQLMQVAEGAEKESDSVAACRVLAAMVKHNRNVEKDARIESDRHKLLAIAERIRLGRSAGNDGDSGSGSDTRVIEGSSSPAVSAG